MAWRTALTSDAKLAFAGDEGAGLQMDIEKSVYAEEERGLVSDESDDGAFPRSGETRRRAPAKVLVLGDAPSPGSGRSQAAEFWEAPGGNAGAPSPLRKGRTENGLARPALKPASRSRPGTAKTRPSTGRSVLFQDADAAYAAYAASDASGDSGSDGDRDGEARGTGIDIAAHLLPSKPGVGHTLYSDWSSKDYRPNLQRINIVDYLVDEEGSLRPYQEDVYYENASIRAVDYWNLKRVAREIRKGLRDDGDVFCSSAKDANLLGIDALVPSRQVKMEAGARIRSILKHYAWRWRRNKAAVKMQATYRMYLTKIITRTKRAERRQAEMDRDGREALRKEREAMLAAEERKRVEDEENSRKVQAELAARGEDDASMLEAAKLQAEISALEQHVHAPEGDETGSGGEEEGGGGSDSEAGAEGEEEGEEESEEEEEGSRPGTRMSKAEAAKAELKRMKEVFVASGMNKAEIKQMMKLYKRSHEPGVELTGMEQQKIEMIRQMMDAETKKLDKCAVLVQSFWRGVLERRVIQIELDKMRYRTQLARDSSMATIISRVYRGHVARRFLRYALLHLQRLQRISRVLQSEGETRFIVQKRIEAKKRQLEISVTQVQKVFRGHLGRRRFSATAIFQWELRLHVAAKKIQAMYRDRLDRYWASYVNKGNLQVLVGRQAARELRLFHKAQVTGTHTAGTLKPPIKQFYPKAMLSGVSILNDGVPMREPARAQKLSKNAKPPPSHPHSIKIRKRWGMPYDLKTLDSTSQTVVTAARKLSTMADALNAQRKKEKQQALWGLGGAEEDFLIEEEEEEEEEEGGEGGGDDGDERGRFSLVQAAGKGSSSRSGTRKSGRGMAGALDLVVQQLDASLEGILNDGAPTGTDGYRGSRPASREGLYRPASREGLAVAGESVGLSRPGSRRSPVRRGDGTWDYGSELSRPGSRGALGPKYGDASAHHWYDTEAPDSPPLVDDELEAVGEMEAEGALEGRGWLELSKAEVQSIRGRNPTLPPFAAPEFGTETERFHIAPGQSQIMPTYLRLQYREQAAAHKALKLKELEDHDAAARVRKTKLGGSLLDLSRVRHQDYTSGRAKLLRNIGSTADLYHETELRDPEDDKIDVDVLAEGKRLDRLSRFGSLSIAASDLVLNLRRRKLLQSKAAASRAAPPDMVVPRTGLEVAAANRPNGRSRPLQHGTAAAARKGAAEQQGWHEHERDGGDWTHGEDWPAGGGAVDRAFDAFGFGFKEPPTLMFTRKGGRLPVAVPVEKKSAALLPRRGGDARV